MKRVFKLLPVIMILALVAGISFSACEKDEDDSDNTDQTDNTDTSSVNDNDQLSGLFGVAYQVDSILGDYEGDGVYESNFNSRLEECMKDDTYTLNAEGTISVDEKGTVCSGDSYDFEISGDFAYNSQANTMTVKADDGKTYAFVMLEKTSEKLIMTWDSGSGILKYYLSASN